MTSLSVLVPVYNEQFLVSESLARLEVLATSPLLSAIQVVVVDDCSSDETPVVLQRYREERLTRDGERLVSAGGKIEWLFLRHERNGGKGQAVQTALAHARCEITVIHDADLEYHPRDLLRIVRVFEEEGAEAVFGSRFAGEVRRALMFRHELGNRLLTFLTNLVTNVNLTDMETCYKAVRTSLLKSIPLVSRDFRMEPELTIKLAKRGARIFEVPISYSGRTYQEGKKINWRDGVKALGAILRFGASDHVYREDEFGSHTLARLARAPRFNDWIADEVRPLCGRTVLEIGSGTGSLTTRLIPRHRYLATDINPQYLERLRTLRPDRPYLETCLTDVTRPETFPPAEGGFDTVVCINVIEHVEDDRGALRNLRAMLTSGGRAVILVPRGPRLMGTLDEVLGHKRRYTRDSLTAAARDAGFRVVLMRPLNRIGTLAWWLNGKVLRRRTFGLLQIHLLNLLTPLFRLVDRIPFLPPLSLLAVLEPVPADAPERPAT
ncbi:MAG: glycosyltransferase [Deltaproteobacteria bacterium]|nr:glycosyltransferase [Deltaproteobacteria bacterium]